MSADTTREEALFDAAIQLDDAAARMAFLEKQCRGDSTLRAAVEELLRFHDTNNDLLATPTINLRRPLNGEVAEEPGTVIGRYRISERIGEGGFGAVYRAEQFEPLRREVALKVIKPGMDTREIIGRFEAERQALAMMNHPHVATVLDAGATATGRPYFVMELVTGLPIDEFCEARRLSVPDRLRLFVSVCRAVQHAHQKGLVHRDLKPSNLLVSGGDAADDDSPPVPKVIDFGIAKALHQPATLSATREFRELLGTPEYMSPEQLTLDADIDTRADIYALGGVLYKLLTGVTPLVTNGESRPNFEELCRAIREQEPLMPSQRVGTAERRTLRGDLDWIVMKALEKDRARRYESVGELAADIERYLNLEPVSAGPPSTWYRASKFVRRNRVLVVATALVLVAIVSGSVAATVGLVRADRALREADKLRLQAQDGERNANEQRQIAVSAREQADAAREKAAAEADKAMRVVTLLEEILGAAHPDRGNSSKYTVRQLLEDAAEPLVDSLSSQPDVEATLRRTIGRAYWHLGDMARAGPHLERALTLRREALGDDDPLVLASQADCAMYLVMVSRFEEADGVLTEALPKLRANGDSDALVSALHAWSHLHDEHGRHSAEADCTREAWEIARRLHGERGEETLWAARAHAHALVATGQRAAGEALARQTLALQTEVLGADHVQTAFTQCQLGRILLGREANEEAEPLLRTALQTHKQRLGRQNSFVVRDLLTLAALLHNTNKRRESEKLARDALEIAEEVTIDQQSLRVRANHTLAAILLHSQRAESLELYGKAIELQRSISTQHQRFADFLEIRGRLLREFDRADEAVSCHREALELLRKHHRDPLDIALNLHGWGNALRELERPAEAESLLQEAAETCPAARPIRTHFWLDCLDVRLSLNQRNQASVAVDQCVKLERENPNATNRAAVAIARAVIALADGQVADAQSQLETAVQALGDERAPRMQLRIDSLRAECLIHDKKLAEAEALLQSAEQIARTRSTFPADDLLFVRPRLARLRQAQQDAPR